MLLFKFTLVIEKIRSVEVGYGDYRNFYFFRGRGVSAYVYHGSLKRSLRSDRRQHQPSFLVFSLVLFHPQSYFYLNFLSCWFPSHPYDLTLYIFFFLFSLVRQVYPLTPLLYQSLPRPTHAWLMPHYRQLFSSSQYLFLSSFLFSAYSSAFFVSPSFMFLISWMLGTGRLIKFS